MILQGCRGGAGRLRTDEQGQEPTVLVYVSLWSADPLDVGRAVDRVEAVVDGFHVDVFDGHNVDDLLFGPDFVRALRRRTARPIDVHLNVDDPDRWAARFLDVGADLVTVQSAASPDIAATLEGIRAQGGSPSLGVELHEDVTQAAVHAPLVDRFLLMGTAIGVKGQDLHPLTPTRVRELAAAASAVGHARPVVVVGGIRADTVAALADAGAAGVVAGSLVLAAPDPVASVDRLHDLPRSASPEESA
jgi:ribulose-phosphate 3-epimerase